MSFSNTQFNHLLIPLEEILKATNNFSENNIIGKGGFGNVYKGQLLRSGALLSISARRLDRKDGYGDVEFWREITILSSLKYCSNVIVSLIGFCDEKGEKIIINSYSGKGSLNRHLSDPTLTWMQRLRISKDVAGAIWFLYYEKYYDYHIIHRNINSSTVLLDDDFRAKLSGFEFSIKHPASQVGQVLLSEAIGTRGYMDPAIFKTGGVTHKSDIYSLGVVLFEILCGRKAFSPNENEDNRFLDRLARFHYEKGTLEEIIHPDLWCQMDPESFKIYSRLAYSCLNKDRLDRPDIQTVREELDKAYDHYDSICKDKMDELQVSLKEDQGVAVADMPFTMQKVKKLEHLRIGLREIQLATNNFSTEVCSNQYSSIYKADLECFDKEYISQGKNVNELPKTRYAAKIKRINSRDVLFHTELEILSTCTHKNIESLLGFCDEGPHMILVYEYISFDHLSDYLDASILTWERRLKICLDIAHALNYLHNEIEDQTKVIHCNISSRNIVLYNNWEGAKISGVGLSEFMLLNKDDDTLPHNSDSTVSKVELVCEKTRKLKESDLYAFGTVMFEILCGMDAESLIRRFDPYDAKLVHVVQRLFPDGSIKHMIADTIKEENSENISFINKGPNEDSLDTFIKIAHQCLDQEKNQCPTIQVVIKELEKALVFQENHKDAFKMTFEDIQLATQNFSRANDVGGGGFGRVYKGEIADGNGNGHKTIVAKRLDTRLGQGDQQFYSELQILYNFKEENIISLVGYSNETKERLIVYEHARKGSLDTYLNDVNLTWIQRLEICINVAMGLHFLHRGIKGKGKVIHRDIKAANILLFDDWKAKVADFGLSLQVDEFADYVVDYVCGTEGYCDPLYKKTGFLTQESDIYSFGVVLFEILCGNSTYEIKKYEGQYLDSLVKHYYINGRLDELVFGAIKEQMLPRSLAKFQNIAYKCLHDDREKRPTASTIVFKLLKALELQGEDSPVCKEPSKWQGILDLCCCFRD